MPRGARAPPALDGAGRAGVALYARWGPGPFACVVGWGADGQDGNALFRGRARPGKVAAFARIGFSSGGMRWFA